MSLLCDIEEYICTICREILLKPVTLPCHHTTCRDCLEQTLDNNKYQCFLCRKFIGSWYRNAKRRDLLINEKLWSDIKERFPDLIEKKLNGEDTDIDVPISRTPQFSLPGEIKREFEISLQKLKADLQIDREKEDELSAEFIRQLEKEEELTRKKEAELLKQDEELARQLALELDSDLNNRTQDVQMQLQMDEELAKKIAETQSPVFNEPKRTPAKEKLRRRGQTKTAIVGPMDRFLGMRKKNR